MQITRAGRARGDITGYGGAGPCLLPQGHSHIWQMSLSTMQMISGKQMLPPRPGMGEMGTYTGEEMESFLLIAWQQNLGTLLSDERQEKESVRIFFVYLPKAAVDHRGRRTELVRCFGHSRERPRRFHSSGFTVAVPARTCRAWVLHKPRTSGGGPLGHALSVGATSPARGKGLTLSMSKVQT